MRRRCWMGKQRGWAIRTTLPSVLALALLLGFLLMSWQEARESQDFTRSEVEADGRQMVSDLAWSAERLSGAAELLHAEVGFFSADARVLHLATVAPSGQIEHSSRFAWRGREAAQTLPDWRPERVAEVVATRMLSVKWNEDFTEVSIMAPFVRFGVSESLAGGQVGVVEARMSALYPLELTRHRIWTRLGQQLAILCLAVVLLWAGLEWSVSRPLSLIVRRSRQAIEEGEPRLNLSLRGAQELTELAGSLNRLTVDLSDERSRVQEAVARLDAVLRSAMDAIITVDDQGKIASVNPAGCRMFGYEEPTLLGQPLEILIPQRFRHAHVHSVSRFRASKISARAMGGTALVVGLHAQGHEVPMEASISRSTAAGQVLLTVILREVSERLRAEQEILALNNSLEERVAQRTAALAEANMHLELKEAELVASRRAAEDASRTKSEFIANMSHELRTPLNAIVGLAHLAVRRALDPQLLDYLERIQQSSGHLIAMVNDTLDFSKIESEKLTLEHVRFTLSSVIDKLFNLVGERAYSKGLELILDIDEAVPAELMGDPLRLSQVLINYGNNAIKFTEQGEVEFDVHVVASDAQTVKLRFEVRDTGIGLNEEQIGRLFQSFQQADMSTSRKFGGTGLGLAIAKRLAQLMGGDVGVQSQEGQGSTFWFTAQFERVPPSSSAADQLKPDAEVVPAGAQALPNPMQDRRVWVVDDSPAQRLAIQHLLQPLGLVVVPLASGREAVNLLSEAMAGRGVMPELILVDRYMPDMDGVHTLRRMQDLLPQPMPRLIMMSPLGADLMMAPRSLGLTAVVNKPLQLAHVADVLRMACLQPRTLPLTGTTPESAPRSGPLSELRGARVLVVDDNEINQHVARELLRDAGLLVDVANNGVDAVDKVKRHEFDLVLMDMRMPVMDGVAATRMIRELPSRSELPIVAMSGNSRDADRLVCLEAGMNDFLNKPIEPERLYEILLAWVEPTGLVEGAVAARLRRRLGYTDDMDPNALDGDTLPPRDVRELEQDWMDTAIAPQDLPTPSDAAQAWRGIRGVDADQGLQRVLGQEGTYRMLWSRFVVDQASVLDKAAQAEQAGDMETAITLIHTLKGVAGNLGAVQVQALAASLESGLLSQLPWSDLAPARAALARELADLIVEVQRRLAAPVEAESLPAPSTSGAGKRLNAEGQREIRRLLRLLTLGDTDAQDLVQSQAAMLRQVLGVDALAFEESVRMFEFDKAHDLLAAAAQALLSGTDT